MNKGSIKSYNYDRGYGFIQPDDKSQEIFFHVSNFDGLEDYLEEERPVIYEIFYDTKRKKEKAINIKIDRERNKKFESTLVDYCYECGTTYLRTDWCCPTCSNEGGNISPNEWEESGL